MLGVGGASLASVSKCFVFGFVITDAAEDRFELLVEDAKEAGLGGGVGILDVSCEMLSSSSISSRLALMIIVYLKRSSRPIRLNEQKKRMDVGISFCDLWVNPAKQSNRFSVLLVFF